MASPNQVRDYLAHWFQLGKPIIQVATERQYLPTPIFHNGHYSKAFEHCWQQVTADGGHSWHLAGTDYSIAAMLSASWDVQPCARCSMPIGLPTKGVMTVLCPCHDVTSWPNQDLPTPRPGINNEQRLSALRFRLDQVQGHPDSTPRQPYEPNDEIKVFSAWRGTE